MSNLPWVSRFACCCCLLSSSFCLGQEPQQEGPYDVDPASVQVENVPRGRLIEKTFSNSDIFPGTERDYVIYVPQQYDSSQAACLMVFQDGRRLASAKGATKAPIVFDNLIHRGEMPVTIGVFVDPGVIPAQNENSQPRFNRSFEYDAIDDRYVRFLIDELLPEVTREFNISADPNDRGICGSSSGGIAAFNVAWQRPDQFRRVYTMVGTYIGLRGANEMAVLVRKTAPKPIRVFLQDGSNDLNIYCGDWWVANQAMLSALTFSGYEVDHVWGEGFHGQKHGGAIFPDAMRFVWKDHPKPVTTHFENSKSRAPELMQPDADWERVDLKQSADRLAIAVDDHDIYFSDPSTGIVYRQPLSGEPSAPVWDVNAWGANKRFAKPHDPPYVTALAIGPKGELYGCLPFQNSVVRFLEDSSEFEIIADRVQPSDLVVAHDGTIYFTDTKSNSVWMKIVGEPAKIAGDRFSGVDGLALSPDQTLIYVSDANGRYVWSSVRRADGTLEHVQPYFHIHSPPASVDTRPHSRGICVDQDGWVLVATKMGIQICDQPGRVNLIIPTPIGESHPESVCFGGDRQTIYATCGGKLFRLKTKMTGAMPWEPPVNPPKPRL